MSEDVKLYRVVDFEQSYFIFKNGRPLSFTLHIPARKE
jgi:hypothetical protein